MNVYNNTFHGCSENGVVFDAANGATTGSAFINNIVDNCNCGLTLANGATCTHTHNLFYGNAGGDFVGTSADLTEITGEDPLLDPYLNLTYGSPAINAGVNVGLPYFGCAPDIGAFEYDGGIVTGTVTDVMTGSPLAGATVSTSNASTTTGSDGTYTLRNQAGTYDVTASLRIYVPWTQSVVIPAGSAVTVNFALNQKDLGAVYYVAGLGSPGDGGESDSNDGLAPVLGGGHGPWASINNGDAKGILNPGDYVMISGYFSPSAATGTSCVPISVCSGTAADPITYICPDAQPNEAMIDMYQTGDGPRITANYIVLNNLWINGTGNPVELLDVTGCVVRNCNITSNSGAYAPKGLWMSGCTNCEVDHNYISVSGANGSGTSNQSWGITDDTAGSGNVVVNNTMYSCSGGGYRSPDDLPGRVFENNIVYQCGCGVWSGNIGISHGWNIFWGIPPADLVVPGTDSAYVLNSTETTNIDPQLYSDNSLPSTSPAIDSGVYVGLPFCGSWPDIGAYEYPEPGPNGWATITGTVCNGFIPVSGALVTAGPNNQASTTTDATGSYTLLQIPAWYQPMTATGSSYFVSECEVLELRQRYRQLQLSVRGFRYRTDNRCLHRRWYRWRNG